MIGSSRRRRWREGLRWQSRLRHRRCPWTPSEALVRHTGANKHQAVLSLQARPCAALPLGEQEACRPDLEARIRRD